MTALHEAPTIVIRPVAGHFSTDISGVDIAGLLAPETVQQLKHALHTHKVIFFRDQQGLFVNPGFTSHIVDVSARESRAILDLLYAEITRPTW